MTSVRAGSATEMGVVARVGAARLSTRARSYAPAVTVSESEMIAGIRVGRLNDDTVRVMSAQGGLVGVAARSGKEIRIFDRRGHWRATARYIDGQEEQANYVYLQRNGEVTLGRDTYRNDAIFHLDRFQRVIGRSWARQQLQEPQIATDQRLWIEDQVRDHSVDMLRDAILPSMDNSGECSRCPFDLQSTVFNRCNRDIVVLIGYRDQRQGTMQSRWLYIPSGKSTSLASGNALLASHCAQ